MSNSRVKKYVLFLESIAEKFNTKEKLQEIIKVFVGYLRKRGEHQILNKILQEFRLLWRQKKGRELFVFTGEPLDEKDLAVIKKIAEKKHILEVRQKIEPEVGAGIALLLGSEFFIDGTTSGKIKRLRKLINQR
jgi:F0F1-type ATP synthase delta subunit